MINGDSARRAIVSVGDGRGFVLQGARDRFVLTAGHCLPAFPPCASISLTEERTYEAVLGPLGGERKVWAECLFADPIADVAVLGRPDGQELSDEAAAYDELIDASAPLRIGELLSEARTSTGDCYADAWLLSLDGRWFGCTVRRINSPLPIPSPLWIENLSQPIVGGMSGSPIVVAGGAVIGIVCASSGNGPGGPNPYLIDNLPGWLLRELG
jgi:hypothetical protein